MRFQSLVLLIGIGVGVCVRPLGAQTTTGIIRGYVTDSGGAPVPDAQVVAYDSATGTSRSATSQGNGFYAVVGLPPGAYVLTVRRVGMVPQRGRVQVQVGAVLTTDFHLAASAVEVEAVTVTATTAVETRTSEVATNVTQQQLQHLPTPSRNFLDLAALAPGMSINPDRVDLSANSVTNKTFSSGGQPASRVNVFIDGASLKNNLTGGGGQSGIAGQDASHGNPFPRDAIQEYRVITQNFKAEYQEASSAIITATTRSGGNTWSGHAFTTYQNNGFVALDTFAFASNPANTQKPAQPDYSRYLGGLSLGGPLIRDRLFFFGSYEGNYQHRVSPVKITGVPTGFAALDTIPFASYNGTFGAPFHETLLFGKLRYTANEHSPVELSVNDRIEGDIRDFGRFATYETATDCRNDIAFGTLKHSYSSGPLHNEAMVSYENFRRNPTAENPGIPNRQFDFGCCIQLGSNVSSQDFVQKRLGFRNDVTYSGWHLAGDHLVKSGVNIDLLTFDVDKRNYETPRFFYGNQVNCNPNCTGNQAYAYRVPNQMIWATGNPFLNAKDTRFGVYLQDDWSPVPRLTFNLGMRWDYESHMMNYDYVTPQDVRDTIAAYYSQLIIPIDTTAYYTNGHERHPFAGAFQPRIGASYALDHENKTTLFAGFGIYYDRTFFDVAVDESLKLTYPQYTVYFANPDSTPGPGQIAWDNRYFTTDRAVLNSLVTNGQIGGREVWLISNDLKVPHSNQWNVGIRRLFGSVYVSAAYVGSRSYDQLVFNWANLTTNSAGGCCTGGALGHGITNVLYSTSTGRTWYDALHLEVNRGYRRSGNFGWGMGLAYTYANRSVAGLDDPADEFAFPQSSLIKKHPANDERSRVVANWILDLPFAFGIQFSGLVTLGSGPHYDVSGRLDTSHPYEPGGFTPPRYSFILPDAWAYREVDLRLRKDFPPIGGTTLAITVELFNAFNYQNYGSFALGSRSDTNFGQPGALISDPRRLQIGMEYSF
jgi:hypothetical protein